ncbi:MAG TPA: HEAT repeat domain-containing protein [Planctomycetota bacterium]|nr:HEAT repeat domain-containing protein [Planctomycetota bacterium]
MRLLLIGFILGTVAPVLAQQAGKGGGQQPGGPGQFAGELKDKQGPLMRCLMNAPRTNPPTRSLALLLVHHGMNGSENNYFGGTVEALKRLKLDDEFVVIAGKSKGPGWELDVDGPIELRVIEWAKSVYPIDPRQVYIWGSSNGASFIGRFGWAHQDVVAAAVGYCGGYNFTKVEGKPGDGKTEWYFVHGGNDNPQNSYNGCKQLREMGYRYVFRQLDGYGHTDIWDGNGHPDKVLVDDCRDDYLRWLHALRHKEVEPEKKEKEFLAKFESKSSAESYLSSKATYLMLQKIGGLQAGAIIVLGLDSKSSGTRAAAAEACETASFGKSACEGLVKCASDENEHVRQNAIRALGSYGVWHYPEALEALTSIASTKGDPKTGPTLGDRLLAVDGLARIVRLAMFGNFEDKKVWETLVGLLDDDEVKLRNAAFLAIMKASKDAFGWKPELSGQARKDAVGRWQQWLAQKVAAFEKPAAK